MAAVTADQVQVVLDAEVDKYLADLRRADTGFAKITANMEKEARSVGAAFSSLRGAEFDFDGKIDRAATGMNRLGGSTANVAAQFQDIAVQLQAGQSPLLIALQQGTQLSAVFEQLRANGQKTGPALAAAFGSIISPISLATIAVIALGGAAIQALGDIIPKTESASEALKRHRDEILRIVEGYDAAKDAVSEYLDSASVLPRNVAIAQITEQFEEMREAADKFRQQAEIISSQPLMQGGPAVAAIRELGRQFSAGEIEASELYVELERISNTDLGLLGFEVQGLIDQLQEGALKAIAFGNAINQVVAASHTLAGVATDQTLSEFFDENAVDNILEGLKALTPELRTQKELIEDTYTKALSNPVLTDAAREQLRIARDTALAAHDEVAARKAAEEAARTHASEIKKSATERQREREAVETLLEKLREEAALVGIVGKEKEILVALRKAGAAATEEERAEIEALVGFTYDEAAAIKANQQSLQDFLSLGESGVQTFIDKLLDGKSATEAWGAALNDIGRQLINLGVSGLFGKTGPVAGLFGLDGARAAGGPVRSGGSYLVGENGPEIFTPSSGGNITPNGALGGAVSVTFAPVVDNRGADMSAVARLETSLQQMASEFVPRVRDIVKTQGRKW